MGAHSVEWSIISSAVDDVDMIALALESVLPEGVEIEWENVKSHHGAPQTMLRSRLKRKREIRGSMSLVQKADSILKPIESRLDESSHVARPAEVLGKPSASKGRSRTSQLRIKIEC